MSYPSRAIAEQLVREAEFCNPGPWGDHCRVAARCAEKIAEAAGMDTEKAYVLGLLHDIGRKFGRGHLQHVYDGYHYMLELGYDDAARICLTHSFSRPTLDVFIGNRDIPVECRQKLEQLLSRAEYDDYDLLIQLCDCLASAEGVVDMQARMEDVRRRYGSYPQEKWDANMALKAYFEEKTGRNIYDIAR